MKDKILAHLQAEYERTRWPMVTMISLTRLFGTDIKDELNQLRIEKKIRRREGVNGYLVEYLPNN